MPAVAGGKVTRISESSPERVRVLVVYFHHKDPGRTGTRKPYGGVVQMFVEKYFAAYFNVPTVAISGQTEARNTNRQTNAYTSHQRANQEFTEQGTPKQVEGYVGGRNLVLKRQPAGKRIIVPSQETRTVRVGGKAYYVSKTASCTVPRFFNTTMCLQLMGTMIKAKHPLQLRIAGKRYLWKKYEAGVFTDPGTNLVNEAGAWVINTEFDRSTHLPNVQEDHLYADVVMNI
ncbi:MULTISPECIES: hypothetical protein [unclassified Roseofilum]|uniref:hypothetical protein n=1 Tax=unclassified Roseofilum TaxID=2620099 RepID=UPI001B038787|nr:MULTISPECIES: hypothetical protein [unclassified Roseofilum]MBP0011337.1 hypothetical protein [Roseofilum sp. Belize Diploria]MBP0033598.1 hypothetical protein [Roseofilum sp. Belize BBD 4]